MKKTRRKFSDKFKSQVALEAVKERESLAEISNVLSPGVKYEYQVKARCTSVESAYSSLDYFTMPYPPSAKFECGTDDEVIEITNTTPKASLQVGDIIYSGQFPIKLTEVSGANGLFKGKGRMRVPMFANAQVNMQFNDIKVNELNQVYEGELVSVFNESSEFLVEYGTDYEAEDDIAEGDVAEDQVISPDVVVDDDINSVYVNDAGEVVVVNTDGEEAVVDTDDLPEGEEVVIEDEHGERWVVDEGGRVTSGSGNNGNTSDGSIETDRTNVVNYTLPLTIYLDDDYYLIDPDKKEFSSGDTITIQSYMAGIEFFVKDAQNQSIELLPSYFPDNSGYLWPPGFTVDIEELEEGEIEEVKILIPDLDTLLVYVEKYKPALEMNQIDILALLSNINEAQKDDKTTCDLTARLTNYSEGDIAGDLGKVKINEKYDMQSLKLKLTHQGNTEISLEDVDISIKEGSDKEKEIAVFKFKGRVDDKIVLELTVDKKDREFLAWYLLGKKPVFKITTAEVVDNDYATVSSFTINRGSFSGYFLERPSGTTTQERTSGSYKRIPEGDYKMCYTYKECRSATPRSNANNETWIKTYGLKDNSGATITRNYILIHIGNYPWNSAGCLLIGDSYSDHTLSKNYFEIRTNIIYEKGLVVKKVSSSGDKLTALNKEYKKLIDLTKKFDDDCENNKCYELEININR